MKRRRGKISLHRFSNKQNRLGIHDQTFRSLFLTFAGIELSNISAGLIDGLIVSRFLGAKAMAAAGVSYPIFSIGGMISGLLAVGMQTMCTSELGKGKIKDVNRIFSAAVYIGAVAALFVLFVIFSGLLAGIYIRNDPRLLHITAFAIICLAIRMPFDGLVRPRISYLQSVKKTRHMQVLITLVVLVNVVICAWILGRLFGVYGVLICFAVSDLMTLVMEWLYYVGKTGKLFPPVEAYLELPAEVRRGPGDVIALDIRDMEDISIVSEQIMLFCRGHKIARRVGYKAAVCFEEIAVDTIQFGFPVCRERPRIELRVMCSGEKLILRLKDNCPMFDLQKQLAMQMNANKSEKRLGFEIIRGMSEDISYYHSFEMNNVILVFQLMSGQAGSAEMS